MPILTLLAKQRDASQRVENQTSRPQTEPGVMSAAEVAYRLRRCRYDRSRRVPIARVAAASGLSRMTLYRAMAGDASEATCAALTTVLKAVADGMIGFERRRRVWEQVEHCRPTQEPGPAVWQDRIVRAADWQPGRCRSCSEQRYSLVRMNGREWYFCDRCIGETDRRMMGAVETRRPSV